jgi:hypothetical protein
MTSQNLGSIVKTQLTDIEFDKIEKFAIDLLHAKEDSEGNLQRQTYSRYILVEGEWVPVTEENFFSKEFKEYMDQHFEKDPAVVDDDGKTYIYIRKVVPSMEEAVDDKKSEEESGDAEEASSPMTSMPMGSVGSVSRGPLPLYPHED